MNAYSTVSRQPRAAHRRRRESGISLMVIVLFLLSTMLVVTAAVALTNVSSRLAMRGASKVQATALAEAGIHDLYDRIRTQMRASGTYPASLSTTQTRSAVGNLPDMGSYTARVVSVTSSQSDIMTSGKKTGLRTTWNFTLEGVGTARSGTESVVRTTFTATEETSIATTGGGTAAFDPARAAIMAAETIKINTNGGFRISETVANRHRAGILANQGVLWDTVGQPKTNMNNPNVLEIDGQIMVPASPNPAYALTKGPTGLGNPNGKINYKTASKSASDDGYPTAPANDIMGLDEPYAFPDEDQVTIWKNAWLADAKTGTTYNGDVKASTVSPRQANPGWGERRITAPAYIDGNLTIEGGQQLYLQPNADPSKPQIIYVRGNVTNSALLYNRGVKLIVEGQFVEGSTSSLYSLQTQFSPYENNANGGMSGLYKAAALVSLKKDPLAILINTSSSGPSGLVYAALGGIKVTGNNEMRGVLIAGGTGGNGGVTISPQNGNSFVVWYQSDALVRDDFNIADTAAGSVSQAFTPSRPRGWVQVK